VQLKLVRGKVITNHNYTTHFKIVYAVHNRVVTREAAILFWEFAALSFFGE
jgi:hypothetical protein